MKRALVITGQQFGYSEIVKEIEGINRSGVIRRMFLCKCLLCGNLCEKLLDDLRNKKRPRSCGCKPSSIKIDIKPGDIYFGYEIIKELEQKKYKRYVLIKDMYGNERIVLLTKFMSGHIKNKDTSKKIKHGLCNTKFYRTYYAIKSRCEYIGDIAFMYYGGRGIKCLWNSFEEFKTDMYESYEEHIKEHGSKETTIDRRETEGHYCKDNCRWATWKEQANNKRKHLLI